MTSTEIDVEARIEALAAARRELERAEAAVEAVGEPRLRDLESTYEDFTSLLGRYEDRATGSGNFQAFIEFQERIAEFTAELPEDIPERETFEAIDDRLQKRRLTDADFEWTRSRLEPVEDLIGRLEDRSEARHLLETTKGDVRQAIRETRDRIDRLETVRSLGAADLDAPVEALRDPIETYNESVRDAVRSFRRTEPSRDVLALFRTAERFPLVSVPEPPADLWSYLESAPVGDEPVPTLLEYADYSRSKLAHYVDSPATFARTVGGNRTYLDGIDAEPFTIDWPPPAAATIRWRGREYVAILNRFAPEETIAAFRAVYDMARAEPERYARLRRTARAKTELTETERERVANGQIEDDLAAAREQLESLEAALEG